MARKPVVNSYSISRAWFDFCFSNPEKIQPNHTAVLFFCIEHCNRLGWKEKFGFPTTMAMEAVGIRSYNTYTKALGALVEWGFIEMVEKSRNQYSSNIVALSIPDAALDKALDKASIKHLTKHLPKQSESTYQSKCSIDKHITSETINQEQVNRAHAPEKKFLLMDDFAEMGYVWDVAPELKTGLDRFLKFRAGPPHLDGIVSPSSVESLLRGFADRCANTAEAVAMIDNTIGKQAKNIIWDKPKAEGKRSIRPSEIDYSQIKEA
jgi:hypothetical protein